MVASRADALSRCSRLRLLLDSTPPVENLDELPTRYLAVRRLQQLGDLDPVDVASLQADGHPPSITMMGRHGEPMILPECLPLLRVGNEVQRASELLPAWPSRREGAVEQGEPSRMDAEQGTTLQLCLFGIGKTEADLPDPRQGAIITGGVRVQRRRFTVRRPSIPSPP
jgi:hypothetical protein